MACMCEYDLTEMKNCVLLHEIICKIQGNDVRLL